MKSKPIAIGYLRRDISGESQAWDEIQVRTRAMGLGVNLAKTIVFSLYTDRRIERLMDAMNAAGASCVICPGVEHLDGHEAELDAAGYTVVALPPRRSGLRSALAARLNAARVAAT
jgi:hypothetical protein